LEKNIADFPLGPENPHAPRGFWVGLWSKKHHAKPQKSQKSHPTRGTYQLPRGALPRVGKALGQPTRSAKIKVDFF
jgi:hypothetical protein